MKIDKQKDEGLMGMVYKKGGNILTFFLTFSRANIFKLSPWEEKL